MKAGTIVGRGFVLTLRYLMTLFFASAATNKWRQEYLFSDKLRRVFVGRLDELDPEKFAAWFIENVGIPHYEVFAWMVCWGETFIALGLMFGFMTRGAAIGAMLMFVSFQLGGFGDASLLALALMFLPFALLPTGHWFGLDRYMHAKYPNSIWFR
jgi:thiosulfate dehydrogenase [quinone] large subunit